MAYKNVGTPRFYVNQIEWKGSQGVMGIDPHWRTLPVDMQNEITQAYGWTEGDFRTETSDRTFIAILGHTLHSDYSPGQGSFKVLTGDGFITLTNICNLGTHEGWGYAPAYDGFTIAYTNAWLDGIGVYVANNTNIC